MSQLLKSLSHYINEPLLTYDMVANTLYQNKAFIDTFYYFKPSNWEQEIKKLEYKLHIELCMLETEQLRTYSPIRAAINSKKDFSCAIVYQKDGDNIMHFVLKTVTIKHFRLIYFSNITNEILVQKLKQENEALKIKNHELEITAPMAQNQAAKMAILNRISTTLRNSSIDIKTLLENALRELAIVFGANKAYFAKFENESYNLQYAYPKGNLGEKIEFDKNIEEEIKLGNIHYSKTIKEHNLSEIIYNQAHTRIILPILSSGEIYGLIIIYTPKKELEHDEKEILLNIQHQISDSVLQVNLFLQISKKKEELETALNELEETQLQLINAEKMASLGQLIANVAHEINTPLASISANNEIMAQMFEKENTPVGEMLKDINSIDAEAIKRITNIVKSLKRFVRLDEEELQQANINSELDLTLSLLHNKIKHGITITKNYGDIPLVACYPSMLNQVFLNILTNALDAMKNNKENPEIKITTTVLKDNLVIKFANNGDMIESKDRKKIMEAGYTTKKIGEGTGLGLAISKKIIDKHKGKISFISNKNQTEFTIEIPV